MTAEQRTATAQRLLPTLITQMALIRAGGGADPRPTIKQIYDTAAGAGSETAKQALALNATLGTDRSLLTPEEFNDMVNYAYTKM